MTGRGTLSVVTFLLITFLVLSEIQYHLDSDLKFDYKVNCCSMVVLVVTSTRLYRLAFTKTTSIRSQVDLDKNETVKLNIDITVAMQCGYLGADVLDISNKHNAWISGN